VTPSSSRTASAPKSLLPSTALDESETAILYDVPVLSPEQRHPSTQW